MAKMTSLIQVINGLVNLIKMDEEKKLKSYQVIKCYVALLCNTFCVVEMQMMLLAWKKLTEREFHFIYPLSETCGAYGKSKLSA